MGSDRTPDRMNARQQRFVDEYLIDLNATQAAIRAGYSAKTAYSSGQRTLKIVEIAEAVKEGMKTRSARTMLTQDWVIERLMENHDKAVQAEAVKDREGNNTGEYVYQGAVANKALELLGKHLAMFTEKHEVSLPAGSGVLAVPMPIDAAQWAAGAKAHQEALVAQPASEP